MNLVDMMKQQMAGEVSKKLGSLAGVGEGEIQKLIGAGLPTILSGLGSVASTKQGAGKIADAIGGMDSSMFGNLAGLLGGSAAKSGGSLLGNLMGGTVVEGVASVIAKFTVISPAIVKSVLGYLAPMVLGSVGSTFQGSKPNADSISRLFAEQKNNIAASLPAGLNLNSVPGFQDLARTAAAATSNRPAPMTPAAPAGGGIGKLLVPLLAIGAICAAGYYFFNSGKEKLADGAKQVADQAGSTLAKGIPTADSMKEEVTNLLQRLSGDLGEITDAAGAEAALPSLKESLSKVTTLSGAVNALPEGGKSMISELIRGQLDTLNPILDRIGAIPGIGEPVKQVLMQLKEKLASMMG